MRGRVRFITHLPTAAFFPVNDNDEMSESVDAAARLLAQYDPARALARYDNALTQVATSPIARAGRVRALWMLRRGEEARLELDELVGDFPADPDVAVAQGTVALGMRDNPAFLDIGWGACFQDLTEANAAFDHARELAPRSPEAIRGQAVVLRLRGDYASAILLLEGALDELGQHAALLVERAYCEYDQSHLMDAVQLLRAALGIDPFCVEALAALCLFLDNRLGAHEEAFDLLEQARQSCPAIDEVKGWVFTNSVAHKREPAEREEARRKARQAFESVLKSEPRRIGAICGLAWLDYDEHGPRAGRNRIDKALAADPYSPHLNYTCGRMLLDLRTPDDAVRAQECFQLVRDQAPYVIYCWSGLADAALAIDDLAAATEVWEEMRRRFPGNTTTLRVGSNLAMSRNRPQEALDLADQALRVAPNRRDLVEQRAAVLLNIGYHAEASQEDDPLQRAAQRWPGDVSLRWRLLLRAEAEGRLHEALGICREIRTLDPLNQPAKEKQQELRRQITRRPFYRPFGGFVDRNALPKAAFSADQTHGLARHVPADTRLAVAVKLRTLLWRESRQTATEWVLKGILFVLLLSASMLVVAGVPWLGGYFGDAGQWNIGRSVLAVGVYSMYWVVVDTESRALKGVGCVVVASVSVWSLLPGESGVHLLLRSTVMAPAAVALLFVGLFVGVVAITEHYRRRMLAAEAHAVLVRDLLKLLSALEREPAAGEMAKLIESIAHAQTRVIRRAGVGDKTLSLYAGHRALGVAAATRDLKQKLVCWDSRTPKILFRRASRMLDAACRSEWGRFTYRKPDLLPRQVRLRVWLVARVVVMGGVVAMGVWLVVFSRQSPDGASTTLAIVTGLVAAIAPVLVPLIEYMTRHGDRFDLRKGRATESDRPSYDESSRGRRY